MVLCVLKGLYLETSLIGKGSDMEFLRVHPNKKKNIHSSIFNLNAVDFVSGKFITITIYIIAYCTKTLLLLLLPA